MYRGMYCPPGKLFNPVTKRCVRDSGDIARRLIETGYIRANMPPQVRAPKVLEECPPGKVRNPITRRCKRIDAVVNRPNVRNTRKNVSRNRITLGHSGVAPLGEKEEVLHWAMNNCKNRTDPITGESFEVQPYLNDMVRLHTGMCSLAPGLHMKVVADHKMGKIATIPGETTHLIKEDYEALRVAMRRRNPVYKLPAHKHQPPPPEWQLYISSDNRSGDTFASVLFVDVTKAIQTPKGIQYPIASIRVDMGFIPITGEFGECNPATIVGLLRRLADTDKLLVPVAGGWKPKGGFPFAKSYWEKDRQSKLSRLCNELTKALS